jgi:hypothetical protein
MAVTVFDSKGRYVGVPGQNLLAPILDQPDIGVGLDDSTGTADADNQLQSAALPNPPAIPDQPTDNTGPAQQIAMAPPPAPSGNPAAYGRAAGLPLPSPPNIPPQMSTPAPPQTAPPPPPPNGSQTQDPYGSTLMDNSNQDPTAPAPTTLQRRQALQPPQQSSPRWYQRLAAAALGGAAGYVNASGKIGANIPQSEVQAAEGNILHPGDAQRMAEYNREKAGLDDQLTLETQEKEADALDEQRQATAEQRRTDATTRAQNEKDKTAAAAAAQVAKDLAARRSAFDKLKGAAVPVYQDPNAPVPPGYTALNDPDVPGKVALVRNGMQPAPQELIAGKYLFGYKAGDPVDTATLKAAYDAYYRDSRQANKPDANEWQVYLDAAGGNAADATANWKRDQIAIAAAKLKDPNAPKPMMTGQKIQIEQKKAAVLAAAEKNAQTRLAKITSAPKLQTSSPFAASLAGDVDTPQAVYADLAKNKQDAQDAYESEIQAATGGVPGHVAYPAAPAPQGAPPPPPQGAPGAPPPPSATNAPKPAPQATTTPRAPAPAPVAPGPRVTMPVAGQVKYVRGQAMKITKVYPDGTVDAVPVSSAQ